MLFYLETFFEMVNTFKDILPLFTRKGSIKIQRYSVWLCSVRLLLEF